MPASPVGRAPPPWCGAAPGVAAQHAVVAGHQLDLCDVPPAIAQGIDLKAGGRNKKVARTAPKSKNVYLALLVKVGVGVF